MLFSKRLKVVLDVNILISGLISKKEGRANSPSYMILKQLENKLFTLNINPKIIEEYDRKLNEKVREDMILASDCSNFLNLVRKEGVIDRMRIMPIIIVPNDPSDNYYFQSGNCLGSDYLVTGNAKHFNPIKDDLIELGKKLKIVTPSEFINIKKY